MRLFVTVGSQLPFDRLIEAVDAWALGSKHELFAQIGRSKFSPANMDFNQLMDTDAYEKRIHWADVIIGHAGIGTVISALESATPLVSLPRLVAFKEVVTEHQVPTGKWLKETSLATVFDTAEELVAYLEDLHQAPPAAERHSPSPALLNAIEDFIRG